MSGFLYDPLTSAIAALVAVGVFLISLAALDVLAWLIAGLLAALSPSFLRVAQVRSALRVILEQKQRR